MPLINTAYSFNVTLASQANPNLFQSSPTLAAGDVKVSIDDGAQANLATLPVVSPAAGPIVKVSMTAAEMNGNRINVLFRDVAGAQWCDLHYAIETSPDDLTVANVVNAVWARTTATLTDAGTIGKLLSDQYALLDPAVATILAKANLIPAAPASEGSPMTLTVGERDAVVAALLDLPNSIETGLSVRALFRIIGAVLAGTASGLDSATAVYKNAVQNSKARVTATTDEDGNRPAISYDLT